ncbi:hypothetical protein F5Y05DRAFT_418857 [Hypoxylon sp. FL0543]|nr:hypothetical protein F5Y05DRAFT_418857 [Hypoxylon sp. FL0543]
MAARGSVPSQTKGLGREYEREQEVYAASLDRNLKSYGVSTPTQHAIYESPVWRDGEPIYHPLRWSCKVAFTPVDAERFANKDEFTYYWYLRRLESKFHDDHDFFHGVVISFWGATVDCVFEVAGNNRAYIQIKFLRTRDSMVKHPHYARDVEKFAYIMARHRPIQKLGPLTDIFGFRFVDRDGRLISDFESMGRISLSHHLELFKLSMVEFDSMKMLEQRKVQDKSKKIVIWHVLNPRENKVIEII